MPNLIGALSYGRHLDDRQIFNLIVKPHLVKTHMVDTRMADTYMVDNFFILMVVDTRMVDRGKNSI